jgi:hypothetical protein
MARVAKLAERLLNAIVNGVFRALGAVVRALTAVAAFALRRGRHRDWRRKRPGPPD